MRDKPKLQDANDIIYAVADMHQEEVELAEAFIELAAQGFNINSPLVWGFYIFAGQRKSLELVTEKLRPGYFTTEYISEETQEDEEEGNYTEWIMHLHVTDVLTPVKLLHLKTGLTEIAESCNAEFRNRDVREIS